MSFKFGLCTFQPSFGTALGLLQRSGLPKVENKLLKISRLGCLNALRQRVFFLLRELFVSQFLGQRMLFISAGAMLFYPAHTPKYSKQSGNKDCN